VSKVIEATGVSDTVSFDDAFRDAVDEIGKKAPKHPDYLLRVTVSQIVGEFGGIDGRTRLLVALKAEVGEFRV
jgi:flavin-binding protein dodecin